MSTPPWPCPGHSVHGEQSCSDLCDRGRCPRGAEGTEQGPSPWEVTAAAPLQEPTQAHSNSLGTLQMGAHCPSPGTRGHVASPRSAADGHQEQRQGPSWQRCHLVRALRQFPETLICQGGEQGSPRASRENGRSHEYPGSDSATTDSRPRENPFSERGRHPALVPWTAADRDRPGLGSSHGAGACGPLPTQGSQPPDPQWCSFVPTSRHLCGHRSRHMRVARPRLVRGTLLTPAKAHSAVCRRRLLGRAGLLHVVPPVAFLFLPHTGDLRHPQPT